MNKKINIYYMVCIIFLAFGFFSQTVGAAPNAKDCIEDNSNCIEADGNHDNEKEADEDELLQSENNSDSLALSLVRMFFALLLVLALIFIVLKFLNQRNKGLNNRGKTLGKLDAISVGQNKSIQLIRVGNKVYLIGVGENVELLEEITDEAITRDLLNQDENPINDVPTDSFLRSFIPQKSTEKNDFKKMFSIELDTLKKHRETAIKQRDQKEDNHE